MRYLLLLLLFVPGIICAGIPGDITFPTEERALKNLEDRLVDGLKVYIETGVLTEDAEEAFKIVRSPGVFRGIETEIQSPICLLCKVAARLLITYRKIGLPASLVLGAIKKLCVLARIENENVCNGAIDLNGPIFVYIIDNKPDLSVDTICGTLLQSLNCGPPPEAGKWNVSLPPRLEYNSENEQQLQSNQIIRNKDVSSDRPIRILQISDLHYDELYEPGANAECGEPLCCGKNQGTPLSTDAAAGNWGDYRSCDMPWYSVLDLMDEVNKHEFDYVYYTGDIINHRVWATSLENNVRNIKKVNEQFKKSFNDIPVYSILGNHEPNPLNEFAQKNITEPEFSTQWLYDLVAEEWSRWLPADTKDSIRKAGYYTTLVRPGFRIVALNSNVAYTFNWWLLYDQSLLQEQLQWLTGVLAEAEKNKEIVHILSHVPTGDNTCLIKWSQEYQRIMKRFSHIITAQFVGHTHYDEMNLFFDEHISNPIGVVFNGGSFTSYINVNPNFAIYEVNPKTLEVEDYEQWIYNLTEANQNSLSTPPRWYKLYSFKEAYGMESMKLPELTSLVQRMAVNQTLLDQYYRFKMREGDPALSKGCDDKCHEENLCNLVTTQYKDDHICEYLLQQYREMRTNV